MLVRRAFVLLLGAFAVAACSGTEGDVLRTRPATSPASDEPAADEAPSVSSWQIQLSGELDTSLDVQLYIVDIETPRPVIQRLKSSGKTVICYFSAGTREAFRDDATDFPESALGAQLPNYPDERYVDIRDPTVRSIMDRRVVSARDAGCAGIHPSGLAAFLENTELGFARGEQLDYDRWLASVAHERGLSIGLVDGDASLREELAPSFDWTLLWSCLTMGCAAATPFVSAHKPALLVEYGDETRAATVCPAAKRLKLSAIIKRSAELDAFRVGCP